MAQELNTKMVDKLPEGSDLVRPFDTVKIYWTKAGTKGGHVKEGGEAEVHPLLAKDLIASGKATEKAPAKKDK